MKKKDFVQPSTAAAVHALSVSEDQELRYAPLIKDGNEKTGKAGKYGMMKITKGLPIHDCPDASPECKRVCYAIKFATWGTLKQGMAGHYSRLAHTDPGRLFGLLKRDIAATLVYEPDGFVMRIHEAGDFVSAQHVDIYAALATEFPMVTFFGYSRGWVNPDIAPSLVEFNKLANVTIRESLDVSRPTPSGLAPVAYFGPREFQPARAFRCPEQLGGPNCIDCGLCWRVDIPVVFQQH